MTNEVKIRRKRFLAFCLAFVLLCCQLMPITADAASYPADDTLTGRTLYAGDTLTSSETDGSTGAYSVYYEDPEWTTLYTDEADFDSQYVVRDYSDAALQSPALPAGSSFVGWEVREIYASSGVLYSVSLRALLESQITYELNGGTNGSNPATYSYDSGVASFADATKPGYTFEGWYSDADFNSEVTSIAAGELGGITLYAKFIQNDSYTITYELNGGSIEGAYPTSYVEGIGTELTDAVKAGYTFDGWYADDGFVTHVPSISTTQTGNVTLYAKFTAESYTITYSLNGGTNGSNPASYSFGTGVASFADAVKEGHTFGGWYADPGFTSEVPSIAATQSGDVTLYAKFTANSYSITYSLNGGTNGSNPTGYTYGTGVASFADAVKDGYTFAGWYADAGFDTQVTSISATQTGDLTLYAKFTENDYTITYELDGGTNGENPAGYVFGIGVESFAEPSKEGYKFEGWFADAEFTTEVTSISTTHTGDVTLHAKFVAYHYGIRYELDGGTNGNNPTGYSYGTGVARFEDATKEDYVFMGWYLDQDYTVKVESISPFQRGYTTLYAKFRIYRIKQGTYYLEAGYEYLLDSSVQTVMGDNSIYDGEIIFYVPESGYYKFD